MMSSKSLGMAFLTMITILVNIEGKYIDYSYKDIQEWSSGSKLDNSQLVVTPAPYKSLATETGRYEGRFIRKHPRRRCRKHRRNKNKNWNTLENRHSSTQTGNNEAQISRKGRCKQYRKNRKRQNQNLLQNRVNSPSVQKNNGSDPRLPPKIITANRFLYPTDDEDKPVWGVVAISTTTSKPTPRRIFIPNIVNGMIPIWRGAAVSPSRPKNTPISVPSHTLVLRDENEERPIWGVVAAKDVSKVFADGAPVIPTRLPKRKSTTVPPLLHRSMAK